jgi:hypothetical protein
VILSVIEESTALDILASSEMGIIHVSFTALANSVALYRVHPRVSLGGAFAFVGLGVQ